MGKVEGHIRGRMSVICGRGWWAMLVCQTETTATLAWNKLPSVIHDVEDCQAAKRMIRDFVVGSGPE